MKKKKDIFKKILNRIGKYKFSVVISLISALGSVTFSLLIPIFIGNTIDYIKDFNDVNFDMVRNLLFEVLLFACLSSLFQWISNIVNNRISFGLSKDLRNEALRKIEILPLKYIDEHSYGDLVSRVINDVEQFENGVLLAFTQFFSGILTILGTIVFMFYINPWIALIVVILTPFSIIAARIITKKTYSMFKIQSSLRGDQTGFIDEYISGQKLVRAFNYESRSQNDFDDINKRYSDASLKALFYSSTPNPTTRFINAITYAIVTVSGALFTLNGMMSIGGLTSFLGFASQYNKPFNEISGVISELQNAYTCAERIFELIDATPQAKESQNAIELHDVTGQVSLENVDFSYNKNKEFIKGLNLNALSGQKIAIVGPTGCGKTTLINLLMRFYEVDAGAIKVDGNNIVNLKRKSLRRSYGMILQDTWIKSGTIKDNITMGNVSFSDEQIIEAAKLSHSYEFIKRLEKGIYTTLKEGGDDLSAGQRQLLCITRVMLNLPPMLILDEATSSIDTLTELKIQDAFLKMMKGRTSFIVAHRLSTIKSSDVILVMKDGNIIEKGNHKELLEKGGFYSELYNSQFVKF